MTRKWCSSCARFLPLEDFWRGQHWCKSCRRAWRMSYREIERIADRERKRRQARVLVAASPGDTG